MRQSRGDNATQGEARPEVFTSAAAPGAASKAPALVDAQRHVPDAHRLVVRAPLVVEEGNGRLRIHPHRIVQPQGAYLRAELAGGSIRGVRQDDSLGNAVGHGPVNHLHSQLGLGLEGDVLGDSGLLAASSAVGPGLGQVQLEVDGEVLGTSGDAEADANLAVGDFSRRAGVLSLHSHRMLALFEEAGVIDNPGFHGLALRHGGKGVPGSLPAHLPVAPAGVDGEVQQSLVHRVRLAGVRAGTGRNRLDALALPVPE